MKLLRRYDRSLSLPAQWLTGWLVACASAACFAAENPAGSTPQMHNGPLAIGDPELRHSKAPATPQVLAAFTRGALEPAAGHSQIPNPAPVPAAPNLPVNAAAPASVAAPSSALPAIQPRKQASIALLPPSERAKAKATSVAPLLTTMASLGAVLALFFAVAWVMRRGMPQGHSLLPSDVVETLGRAPLPGRQQMQLIRCGAKLLLVCVSPSGAETLTEITDPAEVDRLAGLCRQTHPHSATAAFRQVLQQFGRERAPAGFVGDSRQEAQHLTAVPVPRRGRTLEDDDV